MMGEREEDQWIIIGRELPSPSSMTCRERRGVSGDMTVDSPHMLLCISPATDAKISRSTRTMLTFASKLQQVEFF